jgi:uncharacterized OB-fold protein
VPKRPFPEPTPETQAFWDATHGHRLLLQRCLDCDGRPAYFYPRPFCPTCLSRNVEEFEASGRAKLHTYVIAHRGAPGFQDAVPYVIAVVELEEGPRLMSNIVGVEVAPEHLPADLPLELTWEDLERQDRSGATMRVGLPLFRPAGGAL